MKSKRCEKITKFIKLKLNIAAIKAQKQLNELSMNSICGSNVISQHRADQPRTRHPPRHCTNNIFIFVFNKYFIFISKQILYFSSISRNESFGCRKCSPQFAIGPKTNFVTNGQFQIISQEDLKGP